MVMALLKDYHCICLEGPMKATTR